MKLIVFSVSILIVMFALGWPIANANTLAFSVQNSVQILENLGVSNVQKCFSGADTAANSCDEVLKLKTLIDDAVTQRDRAKVRALEVDLQKYYGQCLDERFKRCYSKLKPAISLSELKSLFKSIKSDPRFRYANGGVGMCHYRAENLSFFLAEEGYETKTIRIGHSPTLIAMDRASDGSFNGNYDDYHGAHTLVQIEVNVNGETIPYLLDPQYMEEALSRNEYFIRTTGQICQQLQSEKEDFLDLTRCYFFEQKQNKSAEDLVTLFHTINSREDKPYLNCGWASGRKVEERNVVLQMSEMSKKDKRIHCTNGDTPIEFLNRDVKPFTYKELISNAYSSYNNELERELKIASEQVRMTKETLDVFIDKSSGFYKDQLEMYTDWKKRKEQIEYSLGRVSEMKSKVQNNLKSLP